jgi:adenylate cyclase
VNTASRLEGLSKELGWTIVASEVTVKAAGPGVVTGGRREVRVKGRREAVVVLEVKGLEGNNANLGKNFPEGGTDENQKEN